jgi:hypothetical protein
LHFGPDVGIEPGVMCSSLSRPSDGSPFSYERRLFAVCLAQPSVSRRKARVGSGKSSRYLVWGQRGSGGEQKPVPEAGWRREWASDTLRQIRIDAGDSEASARRKVPQNWWYLLRERDRVEADDESRGVPG